MPGNNLTLSQKHAVKRIFRAPLIPGAILLAALALTLLLWRSAVQDAMQIQQAEFTARANNIDTTIQRRISNYQQLLHSTRAFAASHTILSRQEFRSYFSELRIEKNFPGVQGIGFFPLLPKSEKIAGEQAILAARATGPESINQGRFI